MTLLQQQKSTTYGVEDPITDLRYIVTGWNWLIGSQHSSSDNWISNNNMNIMKTFDNHRKHFIIFFNLSDALSTVLIAHTSFEILLVISKY
jgi:hypothetical protein